ncbi:hypothetical protein [uncultured Levyella sp.]|uniref:hypothetical protein n=1 Tax=uncultured Levyella sp. TaxID=1715800 RepID=UPI00258C8471|nr:hypothetical protein [uncultured Levyella sp.]
MRLKARYGDGEIVLAAMVLSECMRDFRKAAREWKRNPSEETKKDVNICHEVIIKNRFATYVPVDLEEACRTAYIDEMGGVDAHKKAVRICARHKAAD